MKAAWSVLGVLLLTSAAQGTEVRLALGSPTVISDGEGASRVLFRLAEPLDLGHAAGGWKFP